MVYILYRPVEYIDQLFSKLVSEDSLVVILVLSVTSFCRRTHVGAERLRSLSFTIQNNKLGTRESFLLYAYFSERNHWELKGVLVDRKVVELYFNRYFCLGSIENSEGHSTAHINNTTAAPTRKWRV